MRCPPCAPPLPRSAFESSLPARRRCASERALPTASAAAGEVRVPEVHEITPRAPFQREQFDTLSRELAATRRDVEGLKHSLQSEARERTSMQERFDKRFTDLHELVQHEVSRVGHESHTRSLELSSLIAENASRERGALDVLFSRVEDALSSERAAQESRVESLFRSLETQEASLRVEMSNLAADRHAELAVLRESISSHNVEIDGRFVTEEFAREELRAALVTSLEALEVMRGDIDRKPNRAEWLCLLRSEEGIDLLPDACSPDVPALQERVDALDRCVRDECMFEIRCLRLAIGLRDAAPAQDSPGGLPCPPSCDEPIAEQQTCRSTTPPKRLAAPRSPSPEWSPCGRSVEERPESGSASPFARARLPAPLPTLGETPDFFARVPQHDVP